MTQMEPALPLRSEIRSAGMSGSSSNIDGVSSACARAAQSNRWPQAGCSSCPDRVVSPVAI